MIFVRPALVTLIGLIFVAGCASSHTTYRDLYKPYALLDAEPGWAQLSEPPKESDEIIHGVNNEKLNNALNRHPYKITWFGKSTGQLLIYLQMHEGVNCDEQVFVFTNDDGHWVVKPGDTVICLDSNE